MAIINGLPEEQIIKKQKSVWMDRKFQAVIYAGSLTFSELLERVEELENFYKGRRRTRPTLKLKEIENTKRITMRTIGKNKNLLKIIRKMKFDVLSVMS